ncbi:MAG: hypothetical protein LBJ11_08250 [Oscillospiraceae bacterium]|jgi:uridine kinase|nr:hypothetical protein [Oscillospiraceae bacterium]
MKRPFVIGVAGGSASGKSTFARSLCASLGDAALVIPMDSYYFPEEQLPRVCAPVTGKLYPDYNQPSSIELGRLKADLASAITGGMNPVILVEGLFTLWDPEIFEQLDWKVFIDCKADERAIRRLRRNMSWGRSFDQVADVYLDLVRFRHEEYVEPTKWRADFILNGSRPFDLAVEWMAGYVTACVLPRQDLKSKTLPI